MEITVVDVNEFAPTLPLALYTAALDECTDCDAATLTLAPATLRADINGDDPATPAGQAVYAFAANGDANGRFTINANTGAISVVAGATFDRETEATVSLTVAVSDAANPPLTGNTATVRVTVGDINDNAPVVDPGFDTTLSVAENSPAGLLVAIIPATDADLGANARLTYAISSGGGTDVFFLVEAATGALRVRALRAARDRALEG